MPAAVLAQHQLAFGHADRLRIDDLVGGAFLQVAVLMDAGLVRERVAPDDGFVRLRPEGDDASSAAGSPDRDARCGCRCGTADDPCRVLSTITIFFERAVARALADAVDGALDLPRAGLHRGQRVRDRQPRSSWQCTLTMAQSPSALTMRPISAPYSSGTENSRPCREC